MVKFSETGRGMVVARDWGREGSEVLEMNVQNATELSLKMVEMVNLILCVFYHN